MKEDQPANYPINVDEPLRPTKTFYYNKNSGFALSLSVYDITERVSSSEALSLEEAKTAVSDQPPILNIHQDSWSTRIFRVVDSTGARVAEASGPLLDFGHWKLTFPTESEHSDHEIELRPVLRSRQDVFVKDSIPYFWDVVDPRGIFKLYKVIEKSRVEVSKFTSKRWREPTGVLVVDDRQVDVVIAVITSVAVLKRADSFRKA